MPANETTMGAIIIGVPLAIMFTGVLIVECTMYWRSVKPTDTWRMSVLVLALLVLDLIHTGVLWSSTWKWFIIGSHDCLPGSCPDFIPDTLAISVLVSGVSTLIVHGVYSWRIFRFSQKNYWITVPIMFLAVLRFISACVTTAHMIILKSFMAFRRSEVQWVFSTGLILTCIVDLMITGTMMTILRRSRVQSLSHVKSSLDGVIDSLILYTLETGTATVVMTITMLIVWLAMPENLIFMALHFVIAKLYANSVVAMLNYRQSLRDLAAQATSRMDAVDLDLIQLGHDRRSGKFSVFRASSRGNRGAVLETTNSGGPVEVNVTKTMQIHADGGLTESEEAAGGHSIVSKPPQLHLADEIDGHSI